MFNSSNIQAQNNNTPLTPGPSVGLTLVSVVKDDKEALKFNFKGIDPGNIGIFTHTVFAIDPSDSRWTQVKQDRDMASILHIGARFASEDEARAAFNGNDWASYSNNVVKFFTDARIKGVKLRGKVTIRVANEGTADQKVYNQFPMFPNFLSSEKYPTQFNTNPTYDRYTLGVVETPDVMDKASSDNPLPF